MAFKTDVSFLEKLTMGAVATRYAMESLRDRGFDPIELERYSTSNKLWATKVKRLRLADVLCARTGLRVEVRGKSDLKIRMSDSPNNPDRRWDSGLRDGDLVALVACTREPAVAFGDPQFFGVADLRASAHLSELGPAKSAAEGAERDRTWPSIVAQESGEVVELRDGRMYVRKASGKPYSYPLKGKVPYLAPGARFVAQASILAGAVPRMIDPNSLLSLTWDPLVDLRSDEPGDRYAAAKALGRRGPKEKGATERALRGALASESEHRVALEIAGALANLGADAGFDALATSISAGDADRPAYLAMEAVLIVSELRNTRAASMLDSVAADAKLHGSEMRAAAVWGLGKQGSAENLRLLRYIADDDDSVAMHAIAALSSDSSTELVDALVLLLSGGPSARSRAAASEALRYVGTAEVARSLLSANPATDPWIAATLGRLPTRTLMGLALPPAVATAIAPVRLLSPGENWLTAPDSVTEFAFLLRQTL